MLRSTACGMPRFSMTNDRPSSSTRRSSLPKCARTCPAVTTVPSSINAPGLCVGKGVRSLAYHVDIPGISEKPISSFPRNFLDDTKPHEMVQRTGDSWNGELQGFGSRPNANVRARLHEFMEAQRGGSRPPKFLDLVFVFGKQL